MAKQVFINLSVNDLDKSKSFFGALGYTFNAQFTNNNAACMIINDTTYLMLLVKELFQGFTKKYI